MDLEAVKAAYQRHISGIKMTVEFEGLDEGDLKETFRLLAVRQLAWVEGIVFAEEMSDGEKIQAIKERFLEERG